MLSSRYLHLHEALGLGPMWLNRHAKVIPPAGDAPVTQPQKPAAAQVAEAVRTISASAHHARMAAMAAVSTLVAVALWLYRRYYKIDILAAEKAKVFAALGK